MEIWAYGEDGLTLWAITNKMTKILQKLGDSTPPKECRVFYRPSFGRGGKSKSNFGEFDFIILSQDKIYLGESKWNRSNSIKEGSIKLREEQMIRHKIFSKYIMAYFEKKSLIWSELTKDIQFLFEQDGIQKSIPDETTQLANNILAFLRVAESHFNSETAEVINVLLYLHNGVNISVPPLNEFKVVDIAYNDALMDNFVSISGFQGGDEKCL